MKPRMIVFLGLVLAVCVSGSAWAVEAAETMADVAVTEQAGAAVPQLDTAHYASQLFWLIISGSLMFLMMSKVALPRVVRMIQERDDRVRTDLERAYQLKNEAENLKIAYTKTLRDADQKAKELIDQTIAQAKDRQAKGLAEAEAKAGDMLRQKETYLQGERDALLSEVDLMAEKIAGKVLTRLSAA